MSRNIIISIANVINKIKSVVTTQENYTIDGDDTCENWLKYLTIDNKVRLFPDFYSAWLQGLRPALYYIKRDNYYSGFRSYEVHLSPLIACGEGVGGGVLVPHNTGKCCITKIQD